ncbi:MAG: hypothetical protein GY906_22680 [bacterium]|nr:hypothetical protein [bacterium]
MASVLHEISQTRRAARVVAPRAVERRNRQAAKPKPLILSPPPVRCLELRHPTPVARTALECGYQTGYRDRHRMSLSEARICDREARGYSDWWRAWLAGQRDRRATGWPMLYEPLWERTVREKQTKE